MGDRLVNYLRVKRMKIEVTLKKLTGDSKTRKCKLKIHIGDSIQFMSSEQVGVNGIYPFMEKNVMEVKNQAIPDYFSVELISERMILANKTLFVSEAVNMKSMTFSGFDAKETFQLYFELVITKPLEINDQSLYEWGKRNSIDEKPTQLANEEGKLKILNLGILAFNFAKRLDPLVSLYKKMLALFEWENPEQTLTFGFILSALVLFPKISIFILSLSLVLGKQKIFKKVQAIQAEKDITERIFLPEENMVFLQNFMEMYCEAFAKINKLLRQEDRTNIVMVVEIFCKCAAFVIILLFIFSIQYLIVASIWGALLFLSPLRNRILRFMKPRILEFNSFVDALAKKISGSKLRQILSWKENDSFEIIKQFYIYEYERWWVGKHWVSTQWSDETRELNLIAHSNPPRGWHWLDNWTFQVSEHTDQYGYEYSNDLVNTYSASKSLKTIRRRKWLRRCSQKTNLILKQILKDHLDPNILMPSLRVNENENMRSPIQPKRD